MNKSRMIRMAAIAVCVVALIVSAAQLIAYALDALRARQVNTTLSEIYHGTETQVVQQPAEAQPAAILVEEQPVQQLAADTPVPTRKPAATYDPFGGYPNNRYREISQRFKALQAVNRDICAWLTIGTLLDQTVVQRDNIFYLDHDYNGQSNVNGAIFLEEKIDLRFRPNAYILYGHNMKTQAMFGMLHKYEDKTFLREHAILTFDTLYEDGQFAVYAAGTVDLDPASFNFVDFYNLPRGDGAKRVAIAKSLKSISDFRIDLDVNEDDQQLLLVTCTSDQSSRRFVAARRLRDGENEETLSMVYWLAEPQNER